MVNVERGREYYGTIIYKDGCEACPFYLSPPKGVHHFSKCINPVLSHDFDKMHNWIMGCPPDFKSCSAVISFVRGKDRHFVKGYIQHNLYEGSWIIIESDKLWKAMLAKLEYEAKDSDYLSWLFRFYGFLEVSQYFDNYKTFTSLSKEQMKVFIQNQSEE